MSDRTTARARRQRAVREGREPDGVDRLSPRSDPHTRGSEPPGRTRQQDRRREIADELDIVDAGVGAVERLTGLDAFLRSEGQSEWGENLRDQFATEADFVEPQDVDPRINPFEIQAEPRVASDRRSAVADRARERTAADAEFIGSDDLAVDVGPGGVESLEVADDRRDRVADRATTAFADDDPFAEPGDFFADVGALGIDDGGFTDDGERRRAGRMFESETPLSSVDPFDDITEADDGFGLADPAQRRVAAREFESELDLFGTGELDPESDIRDTDDGFGLGRDPAREVAAQQLDDQFDDFSIGPDDIELRETDSGEFEGVFEREVSR